jgi:hypothetical protein
MTLLQFSELLEMACANVAHFDSVSEELPLIVYFETERKYYYADNISIKKSCIVDVNFFTHKSFDPIVEKLEDLFNENGIAFDMESIQYGRYKDTRDGVIYYKFVCEVML